jgi:branched-chain amino acid aminotransferase
MIKDRIVYLNGEYVPWENATVHIMCHSFGRGSAIFEVISLHATASGPAIFRLQAHIDRLFRSAELAMGFKKVTLKLYASTLSFRLNFFLLKKS